MFSIKGISKKMIAMSAAILATTVISSASAGGAEKVEVFRDKYGIPHVFAESRAGAYYGAGWAAAEDSAHIIYDDIIWASGRSAEFLTSRDKNQLNAMITEDTLAIALGFRRHAANWKALHGEVIQALSAYANGFNDYISSIEKAGKLEERFSNISDRNISRIIREYGKISVEDLVTIGIMFESIDALKNMSKEEKSLLNIDIDSSESNAAAISGGINLTRVPIIYGDLHNTWLGSQSLVHLSAPGFVFTGSMNGPFVIGGNFGDMAYTFTRNTPDGVDVFIEKINPDNSSQYWHIGKWQEMDTEDITIKVRGSEPVRKKLFFTRRGWLRDYDPEAGYKAAASLLVAVCSDRNNSLSTVKSVEQRLLLSWTRSVFSFYHTNRRPYMSYRSFVLADRGNNIAYMYNGVVPVRSSDFNNMINIDASKPLKGANPWAEWTGKVWGFQDPHFQLPFFINPRGGVVSSANNAPWFSDGCEPERTRPYWLPNHVVPANVHDTIRGRRLREILCSSEVETIEDMMEKVAFDTLCPEARDFMASIKKGWRKFGEKTELLQMDVDVEKLDSTLRQWNFHADTDQVGMTVMFFLQRETILPWFRADYIPSLNEMQIYLSSLRKVAKTMMNQYGSLEIPWGEVHVMKRGDEIIPLPGGTNRIQSLFLAFSVRGAMDMNMDTLRDVMYGELPGENDDKLKGKILCDFGSSFIQAHAMHADEPVSFIITPEGQSDPGVFPDSPHLLQQSKLFADKKYMKMLFNKEDVKKELCPWGDDPGHEHPAAISLSFEP